MNFSLKSINWAQVLVILAVVIVGALIANTLTVGQEDGTNKIKFLQKKEGN